MADNKATTRTKQQEEARLYFRQHAEEWKMKASSHNDERVNVIQQRNDFVLSIIRDRKSTTAALDVGCGTGDLVCSIARMDIESTGIDFADEMIQIARARVNQEKLTKATFHCNSILDFDLSKKSYDVISANGFIEYISPDELEQFLNVSFQALRPGGSLLIGSRNRLFNLSSVNSFTVEEISSGTAMLLLREAMAVASGASPSDLVKMELVPLQNPRAASQHTGIDLSRRYQFTPAQLMKMLLEKGFSIRELYPVHVHGVPACFKELMPGLHTAIANVLQKYAREYVSLIPYASSFMLHAQKEAA